MNTNDRIAAGLILSAVFALTVAAVAMIELPKKPAINIPPFEQRWNTMMEDIYQSQENLRRAGHIYYDARTVRTERICTKKWCNPHPN